MKSNQNIVTVFFISVSFLTIFIVYRTIKGIMGVANIPDPLEEMIPISLSQILGAVAGVGLFVWLLRHKEYNQFGVDVVKEIRKVTWPTKAETRAGTIVVFVMTAILTVILGLYDWVFGSLTGLIYS